MKKLVLMAAALLMAGTSFANSLQDSSAVSAQLAQASVAASITMSGAVVQALKTSGEGVSTIAGNVLQGSVTAVKWSGQAVSGVVTYSVTVATKVGNVVLTFSVNSAQWSAEKVGQLFELGKVVVIAGFDASSMVAHDLYDFSKGGVKASSAAVGTSVEGSLTVAGSIVNASGNALVVSGNFLRGLVQGAR